MISRLFIVSPESTIKFLAQRVNGACSIMDMHRLHIHFLQRRTEMKRIGLMIKS